MIKKIILFLAVILVGIFATANSIADESSEWTENSIDINEMTVFINGNAVWHGYCNLDNSEDDKYICRTYQLSNPGIERNEVLTIKTIFKSNKNLSNIRIHAWLNTPEKIEDYTEKFDAFNDTTYVRSLSLRIPYNIDSYDLYTIYVKIETKNELKGVDEARIDANIQRIANNIEILSVNIYDEDGRNTLEFNPESTLYADVVLKNRGNHYAEDVYLKIKIGDDERTIYVGDLAPVDNSKEDTKLARIRIPLPDEAGIYTLKVDVYTANNEIAARETRIITIEKEKTKIKDKKDEKQDENEYLDLEDTLIILGIILSVIIIVLMVFLITRKSRTFEKTKPAEKTSFDSYY